MIVNCVKLDVFRKKYIWAAKSLVKYYHTEL